jgi:hypothetical protein
MCVRTVTIYVYGNTEVLNMVYICFKIGFCNRRAEFTNQKNGAISILISFNMSNKFSGSSRLHKELQYLAAFSAYDATNKKRQCLLQP